MSSKQPDHASSSLAIIGLAFRLPGEIDNLDTLWQALAAGQDLVDTIPTDRWATETYQHPRRQEPGRSITFAAGHIGDVSQFDPAFFGISPREAEKLDPQQRLLLELSWQAFEDAGIPPSRWAGTDSAVFVGISGIDHGMRFIDDLAQMSAYSMTGNTFSLAANRLSYVFDLHGPSMAVDTACSSSLVALHMACESIRRGDASTALVGGVNMLLHPYPFVGFTKASMLSAQGRSRAFAAGGDGYVRAEGGAIFLIKPLAQARRDGDRIHAIIRATGANADGRRKTGLTIPSAEAQAALLHQVIQRAGVSADEIDYVEAHGTGTSVGDPIESRALGEVLGQPRQTGTPLPIGSIKSNLGHMEPASGAAGLIKGILTLKQRTMAPSIHADELNPDIDFDGLNLHLIRDLTPFTPLDRPLRVGVNSFGFGGANGHVLIEEAPAAVQPAGKAAKTRKMPPLVLSTRSEPALKELAGAYAERLSCMAQAGEQGFPALAHNAALRREWLDIRLAAFGEDDEEIAQRLDAFASSSDPVRGCVVEQALAAPGRVAFVYAGNGAQWLGMGRALMQQSPTFARSFRRISRKMAAFADFSLVDELRADSAASRMADTAIAQPLLFAIQVGITELLRADGVEAEAYLGHSVGEVAAAWAAGCLDLDAAIEVIFKRSAAQALTHNGGRMVAVGISAEELPGLLADLGLDDDWVELAAYNDADSLTLAGDPQALQQIADALTERGRFGRVLDLEYAFHSRAMDPIQTGLEAALAELAPQAGSGSFVSTVTGGRFDGAGLTAGYWWDNVRKPVRFAQAVDGLVAEGFSVFVEIGPHAILQHYLGKIIDKAGVPGRTLPTLRRDADQLIDIRECAHRVLLLSGPDALKRRLPRRAPFMDLPHYPWQRQSFWDQPTGEGAGVVYRGYREHPLLGYRLSQAEAAWENTLDPSVLPYLSDHQVGGAVVLPGAAYVEMALAAGQLQHDWDQIELEALEILNPLVFDPEHARLLRFDLSVEDGRFQIRSRVRLSTDDWTLHAVGRLLGRPSLTRHVTVGCREARAGQVQPFSVAGSEHYGLASAIGLDYGPTFQGLAELECGHDWVEARIELPGEIEQDAQHQLHPATLDLCFQALISLNRQDILAEAGVTFLPIQVGRLQWYAGSGPVSRLKGRVLRRSPHSTLAEFELLDADGATVAVALDCRFRAAPMKQDKQGLPPSWWMSAIAQPHRAAGVSGLPPLPAGFAEQIVGEFRSDNQGGAPYQEEIRPLLDALAAAYALQAYAQLRQTGELAELDRRNNPLFDWMHEVLEQQDWLALADTEAPFAQAEAPPEPQMLWSMLLRDYPVCAAEITLIGRIGRRLAELASGQMDLDGWRKGLLGSALYQLYREAGLAASEERRLIEAALHQAATHASPRRRLRIAQLGRPEWAIEPLLTQALGADGFELVMAEMGEAETEQSEQDTDALAAMRDRYEHDPRVMVARIDAESGAWKSDTALPEAYDLVLVLDPDRSLRGEGSQSTTLQQLRQRIAEPGWLLLAQPEHSLYRPLIQRIAEPERHEDSTAALSQALSASGFESVTLADSSLDEALSGAHLILATTTTGTHTPAVTADSEAARWLLVTDASESSRSAAQSLADDLAERGQQALIVSDGTDGHGTDFGFASERPETVAALLNELDNAGAALDHVVDLSAASSADPRQALARSVRVMTFVQALLASRSGASLPRLWWLAPGGALLEDTGGGTSGTIDSADPASPEGGSLWGLGRVLMNEHPGFDLTLLDVSLAGAGAELLDAVARELLQADPEREIILRPNGRWVPRMRPWTPQPAAPATAPEAATEQHVALTFSTPGRLGNLAWRPVAVTDLGPDQVEVAVRAVGLNFRDVMYAMGLLGDEAVENGFSGASIGLEFSGVVTRVGAEVSDLAVGDAVMGFGPQCFASHVVTTASAVARKPAHWSFVEAATVPTVFFTAYYALVHLAQLQPGERVLIHGGAGGVGIAAIQIARHIGAEIHVTVGSEEKRDFMRLMGVDRLYNSRALDYADEVRAATGGEGVDVVLNSLAGEAINRNLYALKPFGRFLELGKRDFYENTRIGLRPFKENISYFGIDADQLMAVRPDLAARVFREVMDWFKQGALQPLPFRQFPADHAVEAFRYMQQARQIGKVVVALDKPPTRIAPAGPSHAAPRHAPLDSRFGCRADGVYLVTGGLTGFGFESARWLLQSGAGRVALLGRRGLQTPGLEALLASLGEAAERVQVVQGDVTDAASLQGAIAAITADGLDLRGVIHAAMVLDDALLQNLDADRFSRAYVPKAVGAWQLHLATREQALDFLVMYSSATTFIGNPGQANYVAANGFMERLAALRQQQGLPATVLCWGPLGDVGYLAGNATIREGLESRLGGQSISAAQALAVLGDTLARQGRGETVPVQAIINLDWHAVEAVMPDAGAARYELLRRAAGRKTVVADGDIRERIAQCSPDQAKALVIELLSNEVAEVLGMSADRVDPARSLFDIGLDSLMGVELALGIERRFGVRMSAMALNEGPSLDRIAERILPQLLDTGPSEDEAAGDDVESMLRNIAAQHEFELSDDEAAAVVQSLEGNDVSVE